ncbi:hypothetical protein SLS62_004017 [Diatrype stigma]|uniref:Uncharacterized protein n=1 Tax=Diatrype stigma TaxID=117547 RepID=A0AAN9YTP8_9PEZI
MEPHEDIPPPPYSETDIYSQSGSHHLDAAAANSGTGAGLADDAASIAASSSPGGTNIIYTPPETPREVSPLRRQQHDYYGSGPDHHYPTNANSVSTQVYFESRPVPAHLLPQSTITPITAYIPTALPAASSGQQPPPPPYPDWAPARDVTEQDWHTFVSSLLPSPTGANDAIVDNNNVSSVSATQQRMEHALRDWNTGFFGPRGVTVTLTGTDRFQDTTTDTTLPPAYSPSAAGPSIAALAAMREAKMPEGEDEEQRAGASSNNRGRRPPGDDEPAAAGAGSGAGMSSSSGGRWNPFEISNRGVRIGPLTIDGDRVAIGDSFQVDNTGVRWGGYSVGGGGVSVGGRSFPNPLGQGGHYSGQHPGGERGRGFGWGGGSLPDWDDLEDAQLPIAKKTISAWLSHPEQPVTRAMLTAARANIRAAAVAAQAKRTAAAAAARNNPYYQGQQQEGRADPAAARQQQQQQQQRQEVKILLDQFKALRRRQRDTHRADRRRRRDEKKAARRARKDVKKARKIQRKAERRARRNVDRAGRRAEKEEAKAKWKGKGKDKGKCKGEEGGGGGGGMPHPPPVPPIPAMPAVPTPMPHVPRGPAGFGPFGDGRGKGLGGGRGGGLFGRGGGGHGGDHFGFGFRGRGGRGGWGAGAGAGAGSSHRFPPWARNHYDGDGWNSNSRGNNDAEPGATTGVLFDADSIPGAWPTAAAEKEAMSPPAHLSAKYEAADRIEAEMAARAEELRTLRQRGGGYGQEGQGKERRQSTEKGNLAEVEAEADKLEAEVRKLGAEVEKLRLEADEEFARGLVEDEGGRQ